VIAPYQFFGIDSKLSARTDSSNDQIKNILIIVYKTLVTLLSDAEYMSFDIFLCDKDYKMSNDPIGFCE